jgi:hypothetical protein
MWLGAIDTFVTGTAGLLVLVVPLPLEAALLGWLAAAECALFAAGLPLAYEFAFMEWNKMPFTCSYLPGKTTGVILLTAFLGIFAVVSVLSAILVSIVYRRIAWAIVLGLLPAVWMWTRHTRGIALGDVRLTYVEAPEPAVQFLNLGRSSEAARRHAGLAKRT